MVSYISVGNPGRREGWLGSMLAKRAGSWAGDAVLNFIFGMTRRLGSRDGRGKAARERELE